MIIIGFEKNFWQNKMSFHFVEEYHYKNFGAQCHFSQSISLGFECLFETEFVPC